MEPVLDHEEIEPLERLLQHTQVGERDDRIGADDPERPDPAIERRFDDGGKSEAPVPRDPPPRSTAPRSRPGPPGARIVDSPEGTTPRRPRAFPSHCTAR